MRRPGRSRPQARRQSPERQHRSACWTSTARCWRPVSSADRPEQAALRKQRASNHTKHVPMHIDTPTACHAVNTPSACAAGMLAKASAGNGLRTQDDRPPVDSVCHSAGEQAEHEVRQNRPRSRERGEKRRPADVEHQDRHGHSGDRRTGYGNRTSREEQSKRSVPKDMWLRFDGSRRRGLAHVCTLLYLLLSVAIFRTVAS